MENINKEQRQKILSKMQKLRAMANDKGASENEAFIAARQLQKLQDQYNISLSALEINDLEYVKENLKVGNKRFHPVKICFYGLERFCGVKMVLRPWAASIEVLGETHKIENCFYLINLLKNASEADFNTFKNSWEYENSKDMGYTPRTLRAHFMNSFFIRVNKRLINMAHESRNNAVKAQAYKQGATNVTASNALIVLQENALQEAFKKAFPNLGRGRASSRIQGSSAASRAGAAAGSNVRFSKGVGSAANGGTLRLN